MLNFSHLVVRVTDGYAASHASAPAPALRLLVVVRVLEQDDVRLRPALPDARHVHRRLILHRANLLTRPTPDAQARVYVRPLELHRLHRRLLAVLPRLAVTDRRLGLLDPDRLR